MPLNVTANLKLSVTVAESIAIGVGSGDVNAALSPTFTFANGTGANNIQEQWSKTHTAAASTPDVWVLSALTDDQGRTIPFAKVRAWLVINLGTTDLLIGNAPTHPWAAPFGSATDRVRCPAGGFVVLCAPGAAGLGVTSGSSDQLQVDPGASSCQYQILAIGE